MKEPRRLREESRSKIEQLLLGAARSYRSSALTRAKTLMALGFTGGAALSAGEASSAASSFVSKLGGAKLVATLSALGTAIAVSGGYYVAHRYYLPASMPTTSAVAAPPTGRPTMPVLEEVTGRNAAETPAPPADDVPPRAALGNAETRRLGKADAKWRPPAQAKSGLAARERQTPQDDALIRELAALDAARAALDEGESKKSLALLDAYARDYPRGRLELEAEVLRIDALAKSGESDAAKSRAERFLQRHPRSTLASRVRGYLHD